LRTLVPWFVAALAACRGSEPGEPEPGTLGPRIVVYWTVDTLGATAAREAGWCNRIGRVLSERGISSTCPDGAVAPGSWTSESHTRLLWPEHSAGPLRAENAPDCGTTSALRVAADALGADLVFGGDNPALYGETEVCADGPRFTREADVAFESPGNIGMNVTRPEEERAARKALEEARQRIAAGDPVVLFLNDLEAGGHVPRCWYDPALPACEELWAFAVDRGLVDAAADPEVEYLRDGFWKDVGAAVGALPDDEAAPIRGTLWETLLDAVDTFSSQTTEARLADLLATVAEAGREDELLLVMLADHGENPCIRMPFTNVMNCEHGDLPTDFTARVPVLIAPAGAAEAWTSGGLVSDGAPWAAANLAWGLVDEAGASPPASWPDPEPVGGASSWYCRETQASGLRVEGEASLRCVGASCGAWEWSEPDGIGWTPVALPEIPGDLVGFRTTFQEACGG
jgi:hypothetical protein